MNTFLKEKNDGLKNSLYLRKLKAKIMTTQTKSQSMQENEIVLYQPNETIHLEVRMVHESVWLTQPQIAMLFGVQRPAITKHLRNIFKSGELDESSVSSILEHTASDGKTYQTQFYNLDAILSVGYRVNSINATKFRQWANKVLKEYLLKGYSINTHFLRLDIKRHNSQYPAIPVHTLAQSHDRFLLIDNDVYHVGASIKDLGKRWFAIMKMQDTKADQILSHILPMGGGKIDSKSDYFTAKTISLLRRFVSYAAGLFFALLLFASCQDGQFPKIGTYENSEGEYYHFCTGNNFHCKISEIDHLLSGTYELLGDSTILLTFFDEDGKATGDEVALHFSQCASDSFYIKPVGGSPMHKKKFAKME